MNDSVLAQLAALPEKTLPELKQLWRDLYDRKPPSYNKPFLIKRLRRYHENAKLRSGCNFRWHRALRLAGVMTG